MALIDAADAIAALRGRVADHADIGAHAAVAGIRRQLRLAAVAGIAIAIAEAVRANQSPGVAGDVEIAGARNQSASAESQEQGDAESRPQFG